MDYIMHIDFVLQLVSQKPPTNKLRRRSGVPCVHLITVPDGLEGEDVKGVSLQSK